MKGGGLTETEGDSLVFLEPQSCKWLLVILVIRDVRLGDGHLLLALSNLFALLCELFDAYAVSLLRHLPLDLLNVGSVGCDRGRGLVCDAGQSRHGRKGTHSGQGSIHSGHSGIHCHVGHVGHAHGQIHLLS